MCRNPRGPDGQRRGGAMIVLPHSSATGLRLYLDGERTLVDFFRSLSTDHSVLWTLLVLGALAGVGVGLYLAWEGVNHLAVSAYSRLNKKQLK